MSSYLHPHCSLLWGCRCLTGNRSSSGGVPGGEGKQFACPSPPLSPVQLQPKCRRISTGLPGLYLRVSGYTTEAGRMDGMFTPVHAWLEASPQQSCRQSSARTTCSGEAAAARVSVLIPGGNCRQLWQPRMSVGAQGRSRGLLGYCWEYVRRCSGCVCEYRPT